MRWKYDNSQTFFFRNWERKRQKQKQKSLTSLVHLFEESVKREKAEWKKIEGDENGWLKPWSIYRLQRKESQTRVKTKDGCQQQCQAPTSPGTPCNTAPFLPAGNMERPRRGWFPHHQLLLLRRGAPLLSFGQGTPFSLSKYFLFFWWWWRRWLFSFLFSVFLCWKSRWLRIARRLGNWAPASLCTPRAAIGGLNPTVPSKLSSLKALVLLKFRSFSFILPPFFSYFLVWVFNVFWSSFNGPGAEICISQSETRVLSVPISGTGHLVQFLFRLYCSHIPVICNRQFSYWTCVVPWIMHLD